MIPDETNDTIPLPTAENETVQSEQDNTANVEEVVPPETVEETVQDRNFKELRSQAEKAQRERDELKSYIQQMKNKEQQEAQPQPQEEEFDFEDDDLVDGKKFKRYLKKQRELERKVTQYETQSTGMNIEMKLRNKYPDFDSVVNEASVQRFKEEYPDMFNTVSSSTDMYSKAVTAYRLITKFGLDGKPTYNREKETIQRNINKPRNPATLSSASAESPLAGANLFAHGMTKDLQERLRKANRDAIKRKTSN